VQPFLETQIAKFHVLTGIKCLYTWQCKTFDFILSQLNPIHTQRFSYFDINIFLSNTSISPFLSRFLRQMFYAALHFSKSQFPYLPALLFHGFDTISENCYCSQVSYTGRVKNPCAAEQEECCTVLKVGKSNKPNPSCTVRDIKHVVTNSTNSKL
jgi:hypothetical protein